MFEKFKNRRRQENELMEKVLSKLSDTSKWIYDNKNLYKHIGSELTITWGYDRDDFVKKISFPASTSIPMRYRKKIEKQLQQISIHNNTNDDIVFLNQYLDGEYIFNIKIKDNDKSKISLWLNEQGIHKWYIACTGNWDYRIWFKQEEDAMAFKLKWVE